MKPSNDFWYFAGLALCIIALMGGCSLVARSSDNDDACERLIAAVKERK